MNPRTITLAVVAIIVLGVLYAVFAQPRVGNPAIPSSPEAIARGEYLTHAGGCASCHQLEGAEGLTGGFEIESPFGGTFHVPNITPDEETGIEGWTGRDFLRAMKHGRSPGGGFYWPAFPYRSYAGMTDQDVLDIAAYLMAQPAIRHDVPPHDLPGWQFSWMMAGWNILADFMEGDYPVVSDDPRIQRGAYLARHLGHCGECHTPRNGLGMMRLSQESAGSGGSQESAGSGGSQESDDSGVAAAPAIDAEALSGWTTVDFVGLLQLGMTASFDFVGGEMEMVVNDNTGQLTEKDQEALAAFFLRDSGED